jgi:hypothetical protein
MSDPKQKGPLDASGPLLKNGVWFVVLRADACRSVQGTVMVDVMRVLDERH